VRGKKIIESAGLSSLKSKLIASFKGAKSFARIWIANLGIQSTTDNIRLTGFIYKENTGSYMPCRRE